MLWLVACGLLLALYAMHVEHKATRNKRYRALCDINDRISCSKAFTSRYGYHFGISNAVWGVVFYVLVGALLFLEAFWVVFVLALIATLGSFYLAYFLYFKLKDFCIICTGIYLVNLALLVTSSWLIFHA